MIQTVKTTIRWQDSDGNVLGAIREQQLDLPRWGKKEPMRREILDFIAELERSASSIQEQPKSFAGYAFKAFETSRIIQIKSKTEKSYINMRGEYLSRFLQERVL